MAEKGRREPARQQKSMDEGTAEKEGRPSPIILVIAAAVVLLLVIGAIFLLVSSGSDVGSLAVGNIEKGIDGITFDLMATPSGIGEYTGDVNLDISFEGVGAPVLTDKVHINDGWGFAEVDYTEFIWGNGEYTVTVHADGKEAQNTFKINNVVTSLYVEWHGLNSDGSGETPDHQVEVNISYMFGNVTRPLSSLPRGYDLNGVIERPVGSDISISSDEFSPSLIKLQKRLDHEHAGTYLISGTLVNTFCHIDSPFRTVTIENNDTFQYDAEPFAFAGEDLYTNISGGARVTLDGSGSWDDGTITEYHWDLGDGTTETSDHPTIQHSYTEQGTYYVELTVTDDSGKSSGNQGGTASSLKVTVSA